MTPQPPNQPTPLGDLGMTIDMQDVDRFLAIIAALSYWSTHRPWLREFPDRLAQAVRDIGTMRRSLQVQSWKPIETLLDPDRVVLMWTPLERLFLPSVNPVLNHPDCRVSTRRHWTWATHWMPLPPSPGGGRDTTPDPERTP